MLQKKNPGARIESIFWKKYGRLRTLVSVSISKGIFDRYACLSLFKLIYPQLLSRCVGTPGVHHNEMCYPPPSHRRLSYPFASLSLYSACTTRRHMN